MITPRGWLRAATALLGLSAVLVPASASPVAAAPAGFAPASHQRTIPEPPGADQARTELDALAISSPHSMSGYSRAKFPHWAKQYGECDTREVVLSRDGEGVTQDSACKAIAGTWFSPYDNRTLGSAAQVDIDHMVPLANAWRSGADTWDTATRKAFANDLDHSQLIAVSAASNRSKGDQSPDQWAPPNRNFWCTYSRAWISVKYAYALNITPPEKDMLGTMLETCD
ncbi:HNH endonuclease family protein [Streptomyces fuscichromogenes]|uniref:GmrSD restriction endonucleases C-terminal domain-containing protein n=1 Tax=Streptomyces fuscichromogenes TaxID=1324013 RepID=A0A918CXR7_9ACTN|nr:HNH endonuclease family protein [Streptomyces fuscichromogenes]GGN45807.1 hypothetical protein GCM10011578_098100 [Streptomyces fuscichromogenes]